MKSINTSGEIKELIQNNKMAIIYFTGMDCGACEAIKIKVEDILKKYPHIEAREISGEKHTDTAAEYGVFSLPIFILYTEGKENLRYGRNIDLLALEKNIDRIYNMIF